jgi:hypothetical protein
MMETSMPVEAAESRLINEKQTLKRVENPSGAVS